jgi:hypothetical protein
MRLPSLALAVLALWAAPAAADLTRIDRTIKKEPAYKGKPKYCLLVFGPEARTRVWLVLDGDTLYVDRNGNGDLTEPGGRLKVTTPNQDPASFGETDILGAGGQKKEKLRFALYGWFNHRQGKTEGVGASVTVSWGGRWYGAWGDGTSELVFADRPQDAPVLHVGGPLQMGFESRYRNAFIRQGAGLYNLAVGVGTPGLGKGAFTHLTYWDDGIPKDAHPTAELEFPNKVPGGPPVRVKQVLSERC